MNFGRVANINVFRKIRQLGKSHTSFW